MSRASRFFHLFVCLDRDGDGRVDERDVLAIGDRLRAARGWSGTEPAWLVVRRALDDFWTMLALLVDADGSGDVDADELAIFHDLMADQTHEYGGQPPPWATTLFRALLSSLDADGDGFLRPDEYAAFLRVVGSPLDAAAAFAKLDVDGSGALDLSEIEGLLASYLTSDDDDAPGAALVTGGVA